MAENILHIHIDRYTDDTHLTFSLVLLSRGYNDISHYLVVCTLQIHP